MSPTYNNPTRRYVPRGEEKELKRYPAKYSSHSGPHNASQTEVRNHEFDHGGTLPGVFQALLSILGSGEGGCPSVESAKRHSGHGVLVEEVPSHSHRGIVQAVESPAGQVVA